VLQRRPNTFAQTNLPPSFFACDKAADHTFRIADNPGINDEKDVYGSFLAGDHTSGRHHIRVA
jgi:hypothetical protein